MALRRRSSLLEKCRRSPLCHAGGIGDLFERRRRVTPHSKQSCDDVVPIPTTASFPLSWR